MSHKYQLASSSFVSAPGIVRWAIQGAWHKPDRFTLVNVIARTWNIPHEHAEALVLKQVPYTVNEDESVEFVIPQH